MPGLNILKRYWLKFTFFQPYFTCRLDCRLIALSSQSRSSVQKWHSIYILDANATRKGLGKKKKRRKSDQGLPIVALSFLNLICTRGCFLASCLHPNVALYCLILYNPLQPCRGYFYCITPLPPCRGVKFYFPTPA